MILGIDLGKKTTGIAISEGSFASPFKTITHSSQKEALVKISKIAEELDAKKVVLGFVEGKIKTYFEDFARKLQNSNEGIEVILWDETLTSRQARDYMVKQKVPRMKRAKREHEFSAAIILQSYLDSHD